MPLKKEEARRAIAYLDEALAFEEQAVKRYRDHIASIAHPDVNAFLEGVIRTEKGHMAELWTRIEALKKLLEAED